MRGDAAIKRNSANGQLWQADRQVGRAKPSHSLRRFPPSLPGAMGSILKEATMEVDDRAK